MRHRYSIDDISECKLHKYLLTSDSTGYIQPCLKNSDSIFIYFLRKRKKASDCKKYP